MTISRFMTNSQTWTAWVHKKLLTNKTQLPSAPKIPMLATFLSHLILSNSEEIHQENNTESIQYIAKEPFTKQHSYLINVSARKHAANICRAAIWVSRWPLETSSRIYSNNEGTFITAVTTDLPSSLVVNFGSELYQKSIHITFNILKKTTLEQQLIGMFYWYHCTLCGLPLPALVVLLVLALRLKIYSKINYNFRKYITA